MCVPKRAIPPGVIVRLLDRIVRRQRQDLVDVLD
jgi:hypothetical protein